MTTRRDLFAWSALPFLAADCALARSFAGDGYTPPPRSRELLARVHFDRAIRKGKKYADRFAKWDRHVGDRHDPSNCKGIYQIPTVSGKAAVFWESKMAVDTDGAKSIPGDTGGTHQSNTSLMFKDGKPIDALIVPYFVIPAIDLISKDPSHRKMFPAGPWEDSGDDFGQDFDLKLGTLGVVIFEDRITGAILADTGPAMKIGEASIRVHELIRGSRHPWKGPIPRQQLDPDDGQADKVLYFLFPNVVFDVEKFGSGDQGAMAEEIRSQGVASFQAFLARQG
ncbi:MAG: glycoside hydrolase family 75 protein [Beijerinckiaceae bacterium]